MRFFVVTFLLFLLHHTYAWACYCDDSRKQAAPIAEALEKSSLIILGKVKETLWKGPPTLEHKPDCDPETGVCIEIIPAEYVASDAAERPFDVTTNQFASYVAIVELTKVWKDTAELAEHSTIRISAHNGLGWCGFQFEIGKEYLIYGRNGGNLQRTPLASVCSRTRPYIYSHDDIKILNTIFDTGD